MRNSRQNWGQTIEKLLKADTPEELSPAKSCTIAGQPIELNDIIELSNDIIWRGDSIMLGPNVTKKVKVHSTQNLLQLLNSSRSEFKDISERNEYQWKLHKRISGIADVAKVIQISSTGITLRCIHIGGGRALPVKSNGYASIEPYYLTASSIHINLMQSDAVRLASKTYRHENKKS